MGLSEQREIIEEMSPYDSEPDTRLNFFLEKLAQPRLDGSKNRLGDEYDQAVALLACHYLTLAKREEKFQHVPGAPSGGIDSSGDGGPTYSGSQIEAEDAFESSLGSTTYGALALNIIDSQPPSTPILV